MADVDLFQLAASKVTPEGVEKWQTIEPLTDDETDVSNLGELDVFQALGITSLPYPKNDNGSAEAIGARNCGGRSAVCFGARDTRSKIAAGLNPGDSCLHSTDPSEAAQVRCLGEKRTVVAITKDSRGDSLAVILDGKNDKFQVLAFGCLIEISADKNITITNGQASLLLQGQDIFASGNLHLAGIPAGMVLMAGPPSGSPGGGASAPLFPVLGVGH